MDKKLVITFTDGQSFHIDSLINELHIAKDCGFNTVYIDDSQFEKSLDFTFSDGCQNEEGNENE